MRRRPSSRLLVINSHNQVLLFRFAFTQGPLAGQNYWATPGGALDPGESFADAARRELFEETGLQVEDAGQPVADRVFPIRLIDGEHVMAEERFFVIRVSDVALTREHWTPTEAEVISEYRWWSIEELTSTKETIFPEDLPTILMRVYHREPSGQ